MKTKIIKLENLYFDPDNLRYDDDFTFNEIPKDRIMNKSNQFRVYKKLQKDISELKESILENDFLYIEMIVADKIDDKNYYIVEGNRRLASLKEIQENYDVEELKPNLQKIINDGLEIKVNNQNYDEDILMGMRHITGVKHWNGFSKAKLVVKLKEQKNYNFESISKKIGKRVADVKKQYFSFKILQKMESDGYTKFEVKELYSIFYETLGKPTFREWLEWSEEKVEFLNKSNLERFYKWITKIETVDGITQNEIISNPETLREISKILNDEYALEILDTTRNPFEAINNSKILKDKELKKTLKKVLDSLETISTTDLEELDETSNKYLSKIEKKIKLDMQYLNFLK